MFGWHLLKFIKDFEELLMRMMYVLAAAVVMLSGCSTMGDVGRAMVAGAANTHCQTQPGQVVATQIACQGDACYAVPIRGPSSFDC